MAIKISGMSNHSLYFYTLCILKTNDYINLSAYCAYKFKIDTCPLEN